MYSFVVSPLKEIHLIKNTWRDLPGGPVVKNSPSYAGDAGSSPGQGTKISHAVPQLLRPRATNREKPMHRNERSRMLLLRPDAAE